LEKHAPGALANQMLLVINGFPITQAITSKFLGVGLYVGQHLTWKEHKNISIKIAKMLA